VLSRSTWTPSWRGRTSTGSSTGSTWTRSSPGWNRRHPAARRPGWRHRQVIDELDVSQIIRESSSTMTSETLGKQLLGLREDDPPTAVERMVGFVEATASKHGIADPLQMTIATTSGKAVWAFRYSSEGRSRTLFYSTRMHTLRQLYPDNPVLHQVTEETRLVVSEPLGDLAGASSTVREARL
jgi:hypothetical protein